VKEFRSERGATSDITCEREKILFELLRNASDFYGKTIDILSGVFDLSEYLKKETPEEDFYSYVVHVLIKESRCENASVFMIERGSVVLKAAAGANTKDPNLNLSIKIGDGVAGRCALEGKPILISDVCECDFFKDFSDAKVKIGSLLCVPIKDASNTIGVINLSHPRKDFFNIHSVRIFDLMGLLIGQMLALVHLYEGFQKNQTRMEHRLQQRQDSLRDISERYNTVADASEDMILLIDPDEHVSFINRSLNEVLGTTPLSLKDIFDKNSIKALRKRLAMLDIGQDAELESVASIGQKSHVALLYFIKRLSDNKVLLIMRDITTKRRMEQKTMQTEKLTSLGLLTSGIAHELNNKLTPILGFADLIDTSGMSQRDKERFSVIVNSSDSAKNIVESLLKFSRNKQPERVSFDTRDILQRMVTLYTPLIRKRGIELINNTSSKALYVKADINCIEQVFVNLVNNSIDAIEDKSGRITINSFVDDGYVHIHIQDTGPGISEKVMARIFDPFFTTKSKDKGTGLGLSICYGIVKENKGEISFENTGDGALAKIMLPSISTVCEDSFRLKKKEISIGTGDLEKKKNCMVMVVEDEEDLLDLMVDTLSPYYTVKTFENGRKAYDHIDEHAWELIISDLRMPVMNGMELYHEVTKRDPLMKERFMFITGDTYDYNVKEFLENTGVVFLRKPFHIKELKDIVYKQIQYRMISE